MNKFTLVTGGSRGIGRAVCLRLAQAGQFIIINYKSNELAARLVSEEIIAAGGRSEVLQFDVANREQVRAALTRWQEANKDGIIDVLINNAGIRNDSLLPMMSDEQWDSVIDTGLQGMYNVTRHLIGPMAMNRGGRIINMVSLSGLKGMPGQVNYSAAKAGIIGATKALAQEVARRNITVNAIAPGFIKTDMTEGLDEKELISLIPARRFGEPAEVAELAHFLVSPAAAYITGQVISINGGLYC
ncbi:MAG: 3-oxoacyl-ACP reductase FabG [Taibaiella sp.]|nr:3-oxoacyl-ACP reductase FabG [Taibaiella sp.]